VATAPAMSSAFFLSRHRAPSRSMDPAALRRRASG
jgi:hypothetical protein